MTYEVNGRQFVTVDGGHGSFGTNSETMCAPMRWMARPEEGACDINIRSAASVNQSTSAGHSLFLVRVQIP
jgi:hypothetical protein